MLLIDEIRQKLGMLSEWNNDLAAAVYELGGNVADQTEPFEWEDYEDAPD